MQALLSLVQIGNTLRILAINLISSLMVSSQQRLHYVSLLFRCVNPTDITITQSWGLLGMLLATKTIWHNECLLAAYGIKLFFSN